METLFPIENEEEYVILSASRMTDMPKYYPNDLINEVQKRILKGDNIHTLVIWTKHPSSLFKNPLHDFLIDIKSQGIQLYIQLTITGLGGIPVGINNKGESLIIERNAPGYLDSLSLLPNLITLVGSPERIRLRIDPLIRISDAKNQRVSNLKYFPIIIEEAAKHGICIFSFSFLEKNMHKKVDARFKENGITNLPPNESERKKTAEWIVKLESKYNVKIYACSVPGLQVSKCIDGELLQRLHDNHFKTNLRQPFKRKLCGCTESIDIGGWPPKRCYTGCLYCYSNPEVTD